MCCFLVINSLFLIPVQSRRVSCGGGHPKPGYRQWPSSTSVCLYGLPVLSTLQAGSPQVVKSMACYLSQLFYLRVILKTWSVWATWGNEFGKHCRTYCATQPLLIWPTNLSIAQCQSHTRHAKVWVGEAETVFLLSFSISWAHKQEMAGNILLGWQMQLTSPFMVGTDFCGLKKVYHSKCHLPQ